MSKIEISVETPIERTFRVEQAAGMFDLKVEEKARQEYSCQLPEENEDWTIGAIVGPSGSGKTTIARHAFSNSLVQDAAWPADRSVLDGFDEKYSIKHVVGVLSSVGFSSPPSWLKPFHVLSNGEKFRCDLARALLSDNRLVVFDEFTSVVDRTVAKIGSAAVAKAIRKGNLNKKFVAVTCHYDILEWLQPDWVLDMASCRLDRGLLRRPEIKLEIAPIHRSAWLLFRRHHYLNTELSTVAKCFCAFWGDEPVAFSAWLYDHARTKDQWREHRTVVLPDYQGAGIGNRVSEFCASMFRGLGKRVFSTTGHPAMIGYRSMSQLWRRARFGMAHRLGKVGKIWSDKKRSRLGFLGENNRQLRISRARGGPGNRPAIHRGSAKTVAPMESEQKLLDLLKRYPGATAGLLARQAGLTTSGVGKILDRLIEAEMIIREGVGGGGGRQYSYRLKN